MESAFLLSLLVIIHSNAVALGVGSSTIAIAGFITALMDGSFDSSERRIMGVVYFSLRVAMVMIVLSSLGMVWLAPDFFGWFHALLWVVVFVLFFNAFLMTKHWIPGSLGPAIQAGSWYTLGIVETVFIFELFNLSVIDSFIWFVVIVATALLLVNLFIAYFVSKRAP